MMEQLNYFKVEIITKAGLIGKAGNQYKWEMVDVLAENSQRYCVDDIHFTTVEKDKSKYRTSINDPCINSSVNDSCWGTGIRYTLYSDRKVRKSTIQKQIAEYINEKYGGFSNIDLSFLDD